MKRLFDLTASSIGVLLISPLLIVIIVALRFSKEGEVFYQQDRVGLKGEQFKILKFATMLKNSPNIGTKTMTLRGDPRITAIGRYLRITKLNELPQLFNVLRGEMSFVGARPLPPASFARYGPSVRERIYDTPPGITGIGSIVFRDEEKLLTQVREQGGDPQQLFTEQIYPYKGRLEMWYQDHASFRTDMQILLLTFWQILFPDSTLVFRLFPDLPPRPEALAGGGLQSQQTEHQS